MMKSTSSSTAMLFTPFSVAKIGAALNKRGVYLSVYCLIIAALWNTHSVLAAPAKLDSLDSTFPLDLQPPIFEASAALQAPDESDNTATTKDSYGNPIGSLQPIETPDGRKVVSAQGLQFEIPNYASGITEIKKPSDDLLPPFIDPIVVALPNETPASFTTNSGPSASVETTTVDVESVPLVKVRSATNALPDYILELNDPDIGGPVDYMPSEDSRGLKVIAWDLLPPLESEELDKANSNKVSIATGHNFNAQASLASSHTTAHNLETTTKANSIQNRGSVIYSSTTTTTPRTTTTRRSTTTTTTTPRPTTTPRTTTTTTTLRTTTTPRTTTTRRTTTPRTTTTTTTTTTTPKPDPSTFYKLENGNSYTLPTWLQDIDDPDLDVAVEYIIPEDLNQYNHTVERDILPPLEPFTDLNNLHVTPPPTTARTTTTTTTTTTTKRPTTVSTLQPHWVRAKPTSAKPTISSFNIQFTSLSPSISSNNFAQRTTSTTTTTTTTTTVKPKTTTNYYNRPLTNNTPQTDKIGSSAESESEEVKTVQINTKNPFLQKAFDDGKYRPQNYNGRNTASTTRRPSTTTTTTTTTTTPSPVEKNPFEPTIPPYLLDFDYPDLGPAVPFVYDPNEDENPVDKNILPPSETSEDTNKSATPNSPNSPFSNSQTPQGFTNKFTTSAISLTSSSSIPSKITVPHPSTQQQTNQDVLKTATQQPPVVFVPPVPTAEGPITTTFNKNFAASFEPNTSSTTSTSSSTTTTANADKKVPLSADRESFPPFNNVITGSSTLPSKTTFTKSEDGKVITNNIFLSGGLGATSVKPFGFTTSEKNTADKSTTASTVFKQFGTTSSAAAGFVTNSDTSASFGAKYTGRFGGPPGVLAPQNNAFNTASTTVTKTTISSHPSATTAIALTTGSNNYKFTGSFGGPPGVLKPFDNVKSG